MPGYKDHSWTLYGKRAKLESPVFAVFSLLFKAIFGSPQKALL
jgi:hypothetical protein